MFDRRSLNILSLSINSRRCIYLVSLFLTIALPIKRNIQPKYRLPVLNWVAMKPNQVKGTMFAEIDDEKLYKVIILIYVCVYV